MFVLCCAREMVEVSSDCNACVTSMYSLHDHSHAAVDTGAQPPPTKQCNVNIPRSMCLRSIASACIWIHTSEIRALETLFTLAMSQ